VTGLRVLAADDNLINRTLLHDMLARRDVEVTLVTNGLEAVNAWAPGAFDILILDISMPVMDGITALERIREREAAEGATPLPAIAFTANAMSHQVVEYIAAGFDTHVSKPFKIDDLVTAIHSLHN